MTPALVLDSFLIEAVPLPRARRHSDNGGFAVDPQFGHSPAKKTAIVSSLQSSRWELRAAWHCFGSSFRGAVLSPLAARGLVYYRSTGT